MGDAAATDTAELTMAIESASRSVDRACDRQFGVIDNPQARFYTARYDQSLRRWQISTDDFATTEGLVVEAVGAQGYTAIAGCVPTPVNAVVSGSVWTSLIVPTSSAVVPDGRENSVRVTAKFGWAAVPPTIKLATLIQASRLYARRHAPFGVAGNEDVGQLRLLDKLDPDLMTSVRPFARVWGAV